MISNKINKSCRLVRAVKNIKYNQRYKLGDESLADWVVENDIVLGLTLTFKDAVKSRSTVVQKLTSFNNRLRKKVYGQHALKLSKLNKGISMSLFCVIEENEFEGLHVHAVLIRPPADMWTKDIDYESDVIKVWEAITNSYKNWAKKLEAKNDQKKYVQYSLKGQTNDIDDVYIFCWDCSY